MLKMGSSLPFVAVLFLASGVLAKVYQNPNADDEGDHEFWLNTSRSDISKALNKPIYNTQAKNVIIFLGDGMGITVNTAARIYKGQRKQGHSGEEGYLTWDKFPNMGLIKTYNADKQVSDSASTGTAYLSGVKANLRTLGVDANVKAGDCKDSLNEDFRVKSVLEWAQQSGKDTGLVTTARVTHATPASLYAHSASRYWECDTIMAKDTQHDTTGCKDIALQLVEDTPGKNINVIFAGGRAELGAAQPEDSELYCNRSDGRNLVREWQKEKEDRGDTFKYVTTSQELEKVDLENTDYIMGLFSGEHNPFEYYRKTKKMVEVPSLKQMTETAIKRLQRNDNGFFLLVEGGKIDIALHATRPLLAMEEVLGMDEALQAALDLVDLKETLLIVTADHSHTMTINGYPERGNDILGKTTYPYTKDGKPHTTLMFGTGGGSNLTNYYYDKEKDEVVRPDLTNVDTTGPDYISASYLRTKPSKETHGGEDVAVFAAGPMSHLFHKVHEQTYVAHVMGYAACMGPFSTDCPQKQKRSLRSKFNRF